MKGRSFGAALLLAAFLCCLPFALGRAEEEKRAARVRVFLSESLAANKPFSRRGRAYLRDWVTPEIEGSAGVLCDQSKTYNTFFFALPAADGAAEARLILPQNVKWISAYLNGKPLSADKAVTVSMAETAELRLADDKNCCGMRLMFTSLPVVSVSARGTVTRDGTEADFLLVDPSWAAHGWRQPFLRSEAVISRRGKSAARFAEKHPFNLSLMKDGEKWDQRLLGLRKDSDWLLDGAYSDALRMRNRVLMDIWDEAYSLPWSGKRSGAVHGAYVELVLDGKYKGVFVLSEKQDRKQLALPKVGSGAGALLLKTGQANERSLSPAGFYSLGEEQPGARVINQWHNVEIKYPKIQYVTKDTWQDFYELVRLAAEGSDEEFAEKIGDYADLKNLALYYVFINAMDATDNMRKNMVFARPNALSPFVVVPWDMDASLGRYYSSKKSREKELDSNPLFDRLWALDADGFRRRVFGIWSAYRDNLFSVDHVMEKIEGYYARLVSSGAAARERALYPTFTHYLGREYSYRLDFEKEIQYVRDYMEKRLAWIDTQFGVP